MPYFLFDILRPWLESQGLYRYVRIFDEVQFRAFAGAILAFALVLTFGKRTINFLRRKKIGDAGLSDSAALAAHANSKASTPTMGGVLIVGAIFITTLLLADISAKYVVLGLIVMLWLAALGSVDDWLKLTAATRQGASRQGLHAWEKLVFQLGLGLLVSYFTYNHGLAGLTAEASSLSHVLNLPFQKTYDDGLVNPNLIYLPMWAFILLGVLMLTGMSNAVNITDGMDGLATGISAAVSLGLMVLCFIAGREGYAQYLLVPSVPESAELAVVAGAMGGACLGFLWFNCSPAQVFMGDTGSLALGGLLAFVAMVIRQEILLLLMSAVFLAEIGSVTLQVSYFKFSRGKRIFRCAPYHHHLHLGGWTEQQVVARFWIISVLLVVIALALVKVR
ncbi:MAG: phospho-N-acetylmuramoyl-pentapeptide-transferase [Phycisphaerales bacterium]